MVILFAWTVKYWQFTAQKKKQWWADATRLDISTMNFEYITDKKRCTWNSHIL